MWAIINVWLVLCYYAEEVGHNHMTSINHEFSLFFIVCLIEKLLQEKYASETVVKLYR